MTDRELDNKLKQSAIKAFCQAVRYQDQSIVSMEYDPDKDAVCVRYTCGALWVDALGKNICEMLGAVLKEVAA